MINKIYKFNESEKLNATELMMINTAMSCIGTMKILKDNQHMEVWHKSYYILAVTCLELFPKVFLLRKMRKEGKDKIKINSEFRRIKHNLEKLYSENKLGSIFLLKSNITSVRRIRRDGISRYEFIINNVIDPIYIFDLESIRYGLLAKEENSLYPAWQSDKLLNLCESVFLALKQTAP